LDDSGTATRIFGVAQDVTDIVNIKNKFLRSEENLKLLFDLIPLSIYARKKNGDYIFGNHIFLGHYGITAEELIGKNLKDFATPEEQEELKLQDAQVFESGKNLFVSEFKQKNRTGKLTYWRILKIPFVPIGETDMAMLGIAEDITLEKERVNRIIAYSSAINERNKQLEDFSYKVSHDLRGPLSTIMGIAQVIDFINLSKEEQNYFMNGIKEAVKKMDLVVHELNELVSERPQPENIG
jgi:PAS domain S-box-containing protein